MRKGRVRRYIIVFAAAFLFGCKSGMPVSITNHAGQPLQHVVISGARVHRDVPLVRPFETVTLYIDPATETGIAIAFDLNGKQYMHPQDGYFESDDYEVTITVEADGSAPVKSQLASIFTQVFGRW